MSQNMLAWFIKEAMNGGILTHILCVCVCGSEVSLGLTPCGWMTAALRKSASSNADSQSSNFPYSKLPKS